MSGKMPLLLVGFLEVPDLPNGSLWMQAFLALLSIAVIMVLTYLTQGRIRHILAYPLTSLHDRVMHRSEDRRAFQNQECYLRQEFDLLVSTQTIPHSWLEEVDRLGEREARQFAIACAERVLPIYHEWFPDDQRPAQFLALAERSLARQYSPERLRKQQYKIVYRSLTPDPMEDIYVYPWRWRRGLRSDLYCYAGLAGMFACDPDPHLAAFLSARLAVMAVWLSEGDRDGYAHARAEAEWQHRRMEELCSSPRQGDRTSRPTGDLF